MAPRGPKARRGVSVLEVLVTLTVAGIVLQAASPSLLRWQQQRQLHAAAWSLTMSALALRAAAASDGVIRGVVFDEGAEAGWGLFRDGDGDGLRRADLNAAVDPLLQPPVRLALDFPRVQFGLPASKRDLNGRRLERGVRLGRSGILSFAPEGTASTGTIYLHNGPGDAVAVRVYGPTGRVSLWRSDALEGGWRPLW